MYRKPTALKLTSLLLVLLMISIPELSFAQQQENYLQGKLDGERDAKGNPLWIIAGLSGTGCCLLFGIAGIGAAYLIPPSPPTYTLLGKPSEYIIGYTEGYENKSKMKNTKWATIGCLSAGIINLIINATTGNLTIED